jgi:glutathione S-transferase
MKMLVLSFLTTLSLFSGWVAADSQSPVKVYGAPESPYVRKVMSVLEHKKIAYDLDPTLPATVLKALGKQVPLEFELASPLGKIPAIKVQEGTLADSTAIAGYLEKKWPEHSLYPASPYLMGKAIWFEQYAGSEIGEVFNKIFVEKFLKPNVLQVKTDEKTVEQLMLKIPAILQYLEKSLSETKTFYLVSNELTIADIAVLHHFIGLQKAKVSIDLSLYPKLKAYLERGMNHPSIQAVLKKL